MTDAQTIYEALQGARHDGREADAAALLQQLHEQAPDSRESLTLKVSAFIERGEYHDALRCASSPEGERFPELKAVSLYFLDDPLWQGIAQSLVHDDNPHVGAAMRKLLDDAHAAS